MQIDSAIDSNLVLDDGATNATSTGSNIGQVSASDAFIDLGSDFARNPELVATFDIESLDFSTTDETYTIAIEFSDTNVFTVIRATTDKLLDPANDAGQQRHELVMKAESQFARALYTLGGTTPILNPNKTYLAPVAN